MKNKHSKKVLAVNSAFIPVEFKEPTDAFRIACKERAYFFDTNWNRFSLEEWMIDKDHLRTIEEYDNGNMNTFRFDIPVPPVMVLKHYDKIRPIIIHPTKENIWKRDGAKCAYCKKVIKLKDATIDHVHPQCKGGTTEWVNVAISCKECNHKKDDELLHDIHDMELSINPIAPIPTSILYTLNSKEVEEFPEFWKKFFVEFK